MAWQATDTVLDAVPPAPERPPEWRIDDGLWTIRPRWPRWTGAGGDPCRHRAGARLVLEHSPLYTAGTSADDAELLDAGGLPVHRSAAAGA
jgi:lipoyl(octanoyl) transferase